MQQDKQKYLIDVIPLTRLPLSRQQFFTYYFDRELQGGTLVSIPLFRRNIEGIVLNTRPDFEHHGGFELKKVYSVLEENFLTEKQLSFAQKLSSYYLTPLGIVLKSFIPKRVKERNPISQQSIVNDQQINEKSIILTPEQQSAVDKITHTDSSFDIRHSTFLPHGSSSPNSSFDIRHSTFLPHGSSSPNSSFDIRHSTFLLFGPSSSGKTEVYLHAICMLKAKNPSLQFLILLPEMTLAPQALERYSQYFPKEEIVFVHSGVPKGQFYSNWQKINSGQAKVIIGTRMAIFSPFQKLGLIVVDEEQDSSYKQWDASPFYDARKAAQMLSEIHQAPILFGSATPRVETYHKAQSSKYTLLTLPKLKLPDTKYLPQAYPRDQIQNTKYELIDMRMEKWTDFAGKKKANYSILSSKLQSEISYALSYGLQTILFINHQGMNTFSICNSCKEVLKCPSCERAIIYDESGKYICLHCKYDSGIFPTCKKCGSNEFKNIGIGTQQVEREVKKLFPQAKVKRADNATMKKAGFGQTLYEDFSNRKIDILIGTQVITKGWDNPNVSLVGLIDSDSLFSFPDYLTDERAFSHILQVAGRTSRVGSKYPGMVIIQTFDPQRNIMQKIAEGNTEGFYESQIAQREALKLPPFGSLIKITFKDESKEKAEKETQKGYEKILKSVSEFENISISAPINPLLSKIRGKFIKQIIIKLKGMDNDSMPNDLFKALTSLPKGWSIDVDPINIA
jgi:primosomal protein N' (replication factor Y)